MNFVSLSSGKIINLDLVAFVTAPVRGEVHVGFSATYSTERGGSPMTLRLKDSEAVEFLSALNERGVLIAHTLDALTRDDDES